MHRLIWIILFFISLALSAPGLMADGPPPPDGIFQTIRIRAASSREVEQLRKMRVDIARVMPDPGNPPGKENISGGFIVDAVVIPSMAEKLRRMGYAIVEKGTAQPAP